MGLTFSSGGRGATKERSIKSGDRTVLLCGNPNVGKSTLFNALTGMKQHTGNWTGKTVTVTSGIYKDEGKSIVFTDLPGCYSLSSRSKEEEVARDSIYFSDFDKVVIVCDASCLERNLHLALQVLEVCPDALLCVNLEDEARRKGIEIDKEKLSSLLSCPVVLMSAKRKKDALRLPEALSIPSDGEHLIRYCDRIEDYIKDVHALLIGSGATYRRSRVVALCFLDSDRSFSRRLGAFYGIDEEKLDEIESLSSSFKKREYGGSADGISDEISNAISREAQRVASLAVNVDGNKRKTEMSLADRILTGKLSAFPFMFLLLFFILWLTVKGANYPSSLLRALFTDIEGVISRFLISISLPQVVVSLICEGIIRVVGWVVSVMLPPMAIFFPLFTLLEDIGYLPRVAFNLDRCFKGCDACGKQALTMCMGLGCNAAGVVGCRIIDSPRERDIAILTNSFMPCNGRFPMLISIIGIFFYASGGLSALLLALIIVISVASTLGVSELLSKTVLKGVPSSFTLELPSFRVPNVGQVIVRSVFDRTLFVLGRAVAVAAPTGAVIWLLSNVDVSGTPIIIRLTELLDPIGSFIGLDGVILLGFILGLPANEIVIPIILMCYMSGSALTDYASLNELKAVLASNGWTMMTAVNFLIFTVFHWPCSTTVLTVKKETGSTKKALASIVIPTALGVILCLISRLIFTAFQ